MKKAPLLLPGGAGEGPGRGDWRARMPELEIAVNQEVAVVGHRQDRHPAVAGHELFFAQPPGKNARPNATL